MPPVTTMRHRTASLFVLTLISAFLFTAFTPFQESQQKQLRQEEQEDYYKKWLNQDVVYIISPEERSVFEKLQTDEEREQFIEQFWYRRDPDLRTASNEFKEEHYRRIAYANERFKSGVPGWKTDRGRIYIIHGEPAEIESHKMGESYDRPSHEGGGFTKTFPFEIWRYRYIEGIGPDVELEFVDPSGSGEFRLAQTPWEKDAFLFVGLTAQTVAEEMGLKERGDHPYFSPAGMDRYPGMHLRVKDLPFQRYETLVKAMRAPEIKYNDLKELVDVNVRYNNLPFTVLPHYFQLNERQVLVPVNLQLENRNLTFGEESGIHVARVAVYGVVTSMTNRVIAEFEDDVLVSYQPEFLEEGLLGRSIYQKLLPLETGMRYRLDLIVKDLKSESVGVHRAGLIPPPLPENKLSASSLVLSDHVRAYEEAPAAGEMFVVGDLKVRPRLDSSFDSETPLFAYLQLYNVQLDQSSLEPSLSVAWRLLRDGRKVASFVDEAGESIQFFSGRRVVLLKELPLAGLKPGDYRFEIEATDRISGQSTTRTATFTLTKK